MRRADKRVPDIDAALLVKDAAKLLPDPSRRLFLPGNHVAQCGLAAPVESPSSVSTRTAASRAVPASRPARHRRCKRKP